MFSCLLGWITNKEKWTTGVRTSSSPKNPSPYHLGLYTVVWWTAKLAEICITEVWYFAMNGPSVCGPVMWSSPVSTSNFKTFIILVWIKLLQNLCQENTLLMWFQDYSKTVWIVQSIKSHQIEKNSVLKYSHCCFCLSSSQKPKVVGLLLNKLLTNQISNSLPIKFLSIIYSSSQLIATALELSECLGKL